MHGQKTTSPMGAGMVTDPVCGMQVPADTPLRSAYAGADYGFCSRHCLERFEAEPERYAVPVAPQEAHPEAAAAGTCCPEHGGHAHEAPSAGATTYTCPMHPEVRQPGPGSCPKCGMALEPETAPRPETRVEYTCPMHPEIVRDRPGSCPKCGMTLEPRTVALDERNEELIDMTRRFWVSAVLALPLFVLAMVADLAPDRLPAGVSMGTVQWIQFALATQVLHQAGRGRLWIHETIRLSYYQPGAHRAYRVHPVPQRARLEARRICDDLRQSRMDTGRARFYCRAHASAGVAMGRVADTGQEEDFF